MKRKANATMSSVGPIEREENGIGMTMSETIDYEYN